MRPNGVFQVGNPLGGIAGPGGTRKENKGAVLLCVVLARAYIIERPFRSHPVVLTQQATVFLSHSFIQVVITAVLIWHRFLWSVLSQVLIITGTLVMI